MKKVTIKIIGATGSGKSMLLHAIGDYLSKIGFNVQCVDDFGKVNPSTPLIPEQINDNKINIKTCLVRS